LEGVARRRLRGACRRCDRSAEPQRRWRGSGNGCGSPLAPPGTLRATSTVVRGKLSQKGSFRRWPSFFFELAADGKMKGKWAVTRVDKIEGHPGKQSNRFDVIAATRLSRSLRPRKTRRKIQL
jgi:hypothetical protein